MGNSVPQSTVPSVNKSVLLFWLLFNNLIS